LILSTDSFDLSAQCNLPDAVILSRVSRPESSEAKNTTTGVASRVTCRSIPWKLVVRVPRPGGVFRFQVDGSTPDRSSAASRPTCSTAPRVGRSSTGGLQPFPFPQILQATSLGPAARGTLGVPPPAPAWPPTRWFPDDRPLMASLSRRRPSRFRQDGPPRRSSRGRAWPFYRLAATRADSCRRC
jgi:hypothetical protein